LRIRRTIKQSFDGCFYNADDTRCGRLRIGDIDFTAQTPCQDNTYTGQFTSGSFLSMTGRCSDNGGAGYGINQFIVNWNFASAPTVTVQPDAPAQGGALREVCPGVSVNFNVQNNKFGTGNWTLARWVKWQSAPAPGGPWTDISGTLNATVNTATSFFYGFTAATPGTTYYRAALSSDCSSIFSLGLTTYSNTVQVLIHNASDAFCSAISCDIAYVDPTIATETGATGTPANPLKYISSAVATGTKYVRVAKCTSGCTDINVVQLLDGVVVEGGYVRSGTFGELWTKSSAATDKTIITFSGQENAPGGNNALRHIAAFKSNGKKNWTIKDLDIVTANPPAGVYANDGRGMSNYGVLIINNSSSYNIVRCNITTGSGGAGNNGATNSSPGGGAGGSGGGGGSNGNSGTCNTSNSVATGTPGGGGTGAAATANTTNTGAQGTVGGGGAGYGTDDGGCVVSCANSNGNNGNNGGIGGIGGTWAVNNRPATAGIISSPYYTPSANAENGGNGGGGGGGGGGSGSRGGKVACINCDGFTGGSGGSGGDGGGGGAGGYGGGGSFAIWRNNSNTSANVQEVNIALGAGGVGGNGAAGRPGAGGVGGASGTCNGCVNKRCSGSGGSGGTGGAGGRGRDGANGPTAKVIIDGVASAPSTAINYFSTVTIDNFSQRSSLSGKMCNNSEIELTKTSGTWAALPAGLSFVNDNTNASTSFTTASPSIKVTTNNTNTFYDINNGTLLTKFLYVATDNRNLPSINLSSSYICKGSNLTISSTNNYDLSNIMQTEYVVFANASTAATPYSSGLYNSSAASYTTPNFNVTGKYWVRYRERHNCCGWSRPVFTSFDVIDVPNAPAAINIVGGPYCYTGSGQSFTITIPGSSFAFPAYDSWELYDVDPTFGTPTPIQTSTSALPSFGVTPTQTTTYYVRGKNACGVSSVLSVTAYISADQNPLGVIATATSSKTCVVNDNLWHYFRNTSGEIIAAINSNGQNLGNVTMTVTIETVSHDGSYLSPKHGNGGIGNAKVCLGQPELSMRRWYTITPQFQPTAGYPSAIRLFFTDADYLNYKNDITNWTAYIASNYNFCYGATNSASDLLVSKDETYDLVPTSVGLNSGPGSSNQYDISVPSFSTFRFHTLGGINASPLPVELVSFTGWNQGNVNKLKWVTASEFNTAYYEIQRSVVSGAWVVIGQKLAAGNSNAQLTYDFSDNNPVIGDNYYRLKMVDKDGTFKYSNVIDIPISEAVANNFTRVYPNPTSGNLNVEIQSISMYDSKITVHNILGEVMFEYPITLTKGLNTMQFDFSLLAQGTYIIQFADADGKLHTTKFVKD
jgi:hypothetical protein